MVVKTCESCAHEGGLVDFERFDTLCKPCRQEKGPRKRKGAPKPKDLHLAVAPPKKPKPSGRKAMLHREQSDRVMEVVR